MGKYRDNPASLASLVRPDAIHRDLYIDPEVFELEMQRLWRNAWIFVGHDSQIPTRGDYYTTQIGLQPVIMLRDADADVNVLMNRCAHKGARLATATHGNFGPMMRCSYHGWTYRLDGSIRTIPLKSGYGETVLAGCTAGRGVVKLKNVHNYRGFVFARLSDDGASFQDYFGESLTSIDNLVDRSPQGRLEVAGGTLRYMHDCNWKMFVENLNDAMHPMVAHESSAGTAKRLWADKPADEPKPMAVEQFVPFMSDYQFFDDMGVR